MLEMFDLDLLCNRGFKVTAKNEEKKRSNEKELLRGSYVS